MTIYITKQKLADCSQVEPNDRLLIQTSSGGRLYVAPARDPRTSRIWYPVELAPTCFPELDRAIASCRATACGPPAIQLISLPLVGAVIKLRVNHQRHWDTPTDPDLKGVKIEALSDMKASDLESLELIP